MRLRNRDRRTPPDQRARCEPYLAAGADEARRLGHDYIGTEHILAVLARNPDSAATRLLARLGVSAEAVEERLMQGRSGNDRRIDPAALAAIGIDYDTVRERLESTSGPGALERTRSGCLGLRPRLKRALAHAVDLAGDHPLNDEHVLVGLLAVPDSLAARILNQLGVTLDRAHAAADPGA